MECNKGFVSTAQVHLRDSIRTSRCLRGRPHGDFCAIDDCGWWLVLNGIFIMMTCERFKYQPLYIYIYIFKHYIQNLVVLLNDYITW